MRSGPQAFAILQAAIILVCIACAPAVQPPPEDPTKAQITVLQKQLLELQNLQNENRRRVEEQAAITGALTLKVKALEERQAPATAASPPFQDKITSAPSPTQKIAAEKKKTTQNKNKKKKKTVRRQEQ